MEILVCLRPDAGPADWAALEAGLAVPGSKVTVASVGFGLPPTDGEPSVLELALAVGAEWAVYLRTGGEHDPRSEPDARGVAEALIDLAREAELVICGHDVSTSTAGAIPAFLSALLGMPQILGALNLSANGGRIRSTCLADEGRQTVYECELPAVVSVVPGSVRLRRAPLRGLAADRRVEIVDIEGQIETRAERLGSTAPRTKLVAAPSPGKPLDRVLELTRAREEMVPSTVVRCEPADAARLTIEALTDWGYLD